MSCFYSWHSPGVLFTLGAGGAGLHVIFDASPQRIQRMESWGPAGAVHRIKQFQQVYRIYRPCCAGVGAGPRGPVGVFAGRGPDEWNPRSLGMEITPKR